MKCEHCGSETVANEDGNCLICSHPIHGAPLAVPPRPIVPEGSSYGRKIEASHQYYEANKVAILADVESMGRKAACERWTIASATMNYLLERWNDKERQVVETQIQTQVAANKDETSPDLLSEVLSSVNQKLESIMKKLDEIDIDKVTGELLSWGTGLDDDMKADIVNCFWCHYQQNPENAKKLLKLVEALTYC